MRILFMLKVDIVERFIWSTLMGWKIVSVQALGDYFDVVLENTTLQNVPMFMNQFSTLFDSIYARGSYANRKIVKPKSIFANKIVANTKATSKFQKLSFAVNALNKVKLGKGKSQQIV
jgi:hypothetical protein